MWEGSYLGDGLGDFFVTTTKFIEFLASAVTSISDATDLSLEK